MADTEPLLKDDPASARNRRISIALLREGGPLSKAAMAKVKAGKNSISGATGRARACANALPFPGPRKFQ